jgi:predicted aspartyl protease
VFTVPVEFGNSIATEFRRVDAMVDTGASHTTLPGSMLRELGITPHTSGRFKLATGDIVERPIGRTWVRIDGHTEMTIVVFGDEGATPLLGAVTLEEFRLGVDPVGRKLIDVTAYLTGSSMSDGS